MNKSKFNNRQMSKYRNKLKNANRYIIDKLICEEFCYGVGLQAIERSSLSSELIELKTLDYVISKTS